MATLLGAINGTTTYGRFGKNNVAKRANLIANYVAGSGYRGESLESIIPFLKRELGENITKEKISATLRLLWKNGYYFHDNKDWKKTIIYENKKFWQGRRNK
jgi:hypothetical protein